MRTKAASGLSLANSYVIPSVGMQIKNVSFKITCDNLDSFFVGVSSVEFSQLKEELGTSKGTIGLNLKSGFILGDGSLMNNIQKIKKNDLVKLELHREKSLMNIYVNEELVFNTKKLP